MSDDRVRDARPPPTADVGIGAWIERRARIAPEKPALIHRGVTTTYGQLADRIRRLAGGLGHLGVGRGDRVAWIGRNHPAFLESLFGVARLGAVLAPVNHRLPAEVQRAVLADTEPVALVVHESGAPDPLPPSIRTRIVVGDGPVAPGDLPYEALLATAADPGAGEPVGLDELCLLPHTSGTTGVPKEVMLTHGNVTWNVVDFLSSVDFRGDDVTIAIAPFFRVGGTGVNVLPVVFVGGSVVIPESGDAAEIIGLIERHRVTVGFANPDLLDALVRGERWPAADLSSLRFVITGGAPVPERLIRAFLDRGVPLVQGYGLSEAAPLVLMLRTEDALRKIGAAGRPPLMVDVRIAGPDGHDVGLGETGELLARGLNVMAGYWRRPVETAAVLEPDGWLRTGDAARMDDEGDVWIVDRVEAGFVAAGRRHYPGDIERVLLTHPAVADVGVVAVPGPGDDPVPVAFVVARAGSRPGASDLLAFAYDRLPPPERPVEIRFVDALPRSTVGKLLRAELRAAAIASAGDPPD